MHSITTQPCFMQAQLPSSPDFPSSCLLTEMMPPNDDNDKASQCYMEALRRELEQNWQGGYTQMPDEVRHDPTLSPRAKIVYEQLLSYMWFKSDRCWPSQQTLAEATGYSRRTVIRALQDLYKRGYIEKWRRGQGETNYYFINPISFVHSFRNTGPGKGILLLANGPEHRTDMTTLPAPDVLDEACHPVTSRSDRVSQSVTSRSDRVTHPDVPICHTKHREEKEIQTESIASNLSNFSNLSPSESFINSTINDIPKNPFPSIPQTEEMNQHPTPLIQSKPNMQLNGFEKHGATEQIRTLEVSKRTEQQPHVTGTGISAEHFIDLDFPPKRNRRPIPDFITRIITDYSREMGDNPKSIKSNITRAAKIYYTACAIFTDIQDDPEGHFIQLLYQAKENVGHVTNIRHRINSYLNRMPAFFACLENLFGFKPEEQAYLRSDEPLYAN